MVVEAYTAAEIVCRKVLMHVAVDKGAPENQSFAAYLTYLETQGFITAPMRSWTQRIRLHGNESTHDLPAPDEQRAKDTISFTAELLRIVYEMPYMEGRYAPPTSSR
jgi:hypothetical protein